MKIYLVGGAVRDKLMGKTPKDFDYSVVLEDNDKTKMNGMNFCFGPMIDPFTFMGHKLRKEGFKVFVHSPEYFTIRAHFPKGHKNARLTADFVMARKEGDYADGRRPDFVEVGTLGDDLARRDFTMNAIAEDEDGNIIDPYNGRLAISQGRIEAVGDAKDKMMEDSLRVLRALRFRVQLGFKMDTDLAMTMTDVDVLSALKDNVSDERKMAELNKMFRASVINSLMALEHFSVLRDAIFSGKVNLEATMKQKGFNS